MAEIAALFGVELGEVFTVIETNFFDGSEYHIHFKAKFEKTGFFREFNGVWCIDYTTAIEMIVCPEKYKFEFAPYVPNEGEKFWYVTESSHVDYMTMQSKSTFAAMVVVLGNCYRTERQAELSTEKWKKRFEECLEVKEVDNG